jgi:hypothetical protein
MLETEQRMQFLSHVDNGEGKHFPLVSTLVYKLHDPTTLDIDLLLLGDEAERRDALIYLTRPPFYDQIWLHSDEPKFSSVEVQGIHHVSNHEYRVSFGASEVQIGLNHNPSEHETTWFVKAELTPSGILEAVGIKHFSFTGDITLERLETSKVEVATPFGTLEASERYAHYEDEEYANKVTHSVQRASIKGLIKIPAGENIANVNASLRKEIADICTVLSFCYRQPVNFYEIQYITDPNTTAQEQMHTATVRRRRSELERKNRQDELIDRDNLANGGLNELLTKYKSSSQVEELRRTMRFLSASYRSTTLESSYFLAYSALDLITSVIRGGDVYLMDKSKWRRIQRLLRQYIDSIAVPEGLTAILTQLKEKLPELRRTSGVNRVIKACEQLDVQTADLWRKDGFETGLRSATRIRDSLFHAASVGDLDDMWVNLIRIRVLVERLLLGVLDWPDDRTWVWKNQQLARIRQ